MRSMSVFGARCRSLRSLAFVAPIVLLAALFTVDCRSGSGSSSGPARPPATTSAPAAAAAPAPPAALAAPAASEQTPILILLSFDGFRWDYDAKVPTPNLQRVIARGVRAERLIPSFPSKTFPNHYTIITGLYPEHHGIVS